MNDNNVAQTPDLIFRRLLEPFPMSDVPWLLLCIGLALLLAAGLVLLMGRDRHRPFWSQLKGGLGAWLVVLALGEVVVAGCLLTYLVERQRQPLSGLIWLAVVIPLLFVAKVYVLVQYWRDTRQLTPVTGALAKTGKALLLLIAWFAPSALLGLIVINLLIPPDQQRFFWWQLAVPVAMTLFLTAIYVAITILSQGMQAAVVTPGSAPLSLLRRWFLDGCSVAMVGARILVLEILAFFFLLPAWQQSEKTEQHSKVIVIFDTSDSITQVRDEIPPPGVAFASMPTRQDKVMQFLETARLDPRNKEQLTFLQALQKTNPVTIFRMGSMADPEYTQVDKGIHLWKRELVENQVIERSGSTDSKNPGQAWNKQNWADWLVHDPHRLDATIEELKTDPAAAGELKKVQELLDFERITFGSTNVAGSVLDVLKQEGGNMVQGIVVFTDGRSTEESAQSYRELAEISRQKKVPIFAVRVGEDRPKVELEIAEVRVPEQVRPDDTFPVTVRVSARGMSAEKVPVTIDIYAPGQDPKAKDVKPAFSIPKEITLSLKDPIQGEEQIEISPDAFGEVPELQPAPKPEEKKPGDEPKKDDPKKSEPVPSDGKKKLRTGSWHFVVRVPRDPREIFPDAEHTNADAPAEVKVVDRKMNILLFASAPTHEYQFVRTMLVREKDRARVDLSIYVQPAPGLNEPRNGIVQDVDPNRLLKQFPYLRQDPSQDNGEDALYNLQNYDLIIAFDPDWMRLSGPELNNVKAWVENGGGLIAVGGPINTTALARPGTFRDTLKPILDVYPVVLADSRIQDLERSTRDPFPLHFQNRNITPEMEFLNLAEEKDETGQNKLISGWTEFLYGDKPEGSPPALLRGIFNFYPVLLPKKGSMVIATFGDPKVEHLKDKDQTEMPYLVINPVVGRGKTVWIGSGELWRLRGYREAYHERFWTKLCRYVGSSNMTKQNTRVVPYLSKRMPAHSIGHLEAQILDKSLNPLAKNAKPPELVIEPPPGVGDDPGDKDGRERKKKFLLKPKATSEDWRGWFEVDFPVNQAGNGYRYELTIPDIGNEMVSGKFDVTPSNPELDNTAPDLKALYYFLASDAAEVRNRLPEEVRREMGERLRRPAMTAAKDDGKKPDTVDRPDDRKDAVREGGTRLYFDLNNAELIPRLMTTAEKAQINKGKTEDIIYKFTARLEVWAVGITIGLCTWMTFLFIGQFISDPRGVSVSWFVWRIVGLIVVPVVGAIVFATGLYLDSIGQPVWIPVAMMAVVILLCFEWLTRKLLRLA
jgi:hypothetical protein